MERDAYGHLETPHVLYQPYAVDVGQVANAETWNAETRRSGGRGKGDELGGGKRGPYLRTQQLAVIFRDHVLSDRIGCVYQGMDGQEAAEDLVHRLQVAYERLGSGKRGPYLVSIILDGENCWESYPDYGEAFLHHLYQLLS